MTDLNDECADDLLATAARFEQRLALTSPDTKAHGSIEQIVKVCRNYASHHFGRAAEDPRLQAPPAPEAAPSPEPTPEPAPEPAVLAHALEEPHDEEAERKERFAPMEPFSEPPAEEVQPSFTEETFEAEDITTTPDLDLPPAIPVEPPIQPALFGMDTKIISSQRNSANALVDKQYVMLISSQMTPDEQNNVVNLPEDHPDRVWLGAMRDTAEKLWTEIANMGELDLAAFDPSDRWPQR